MIYDGRGARFVDKHVSLVAYVRAGRERRSFIATYRSNEARTTGPPGGKGNTTGNEATQYYRGLPADSRCLRQSHGARGVNYDGLGGESTFWLSVEPSRDDIEVSMA